jgi:glycosyltransferase involved in cell wall biosynthesis
MRVLFVPTTDWTSPVIFRHRMLAKHWAAQGHDIHVLHIDLMGNNHVPHTPDGIVLHQTKRFRKVGHGVQNEVLHYAGNFLKYWSAARNVIRSNGFDIVVSANLVPSYWVSQAAGKAGIPVLYDVVDYFPDFVNRYKLGRPGRLALRRLATLAMGANLEVASAVVTPSQSLAGHMQTNFAEALDGKAIHTIPNGVDLDLFDPGRYRTASAHDRGKHVSMVFVGTLEFWVDTRFLIGLIREFNSLGYRPKLTIAGEEPDYAHGRLKEGLREAVRSLGLAEDSLKFLGLVPHARVPEVISQADVCLLPFKANLLISQYACPLKLFEYLAMGKPVIATHLAEVVSLAGRAIIATDDPREAVRRYLAMKDHPSEQLEMIGRGQVIAKSHEWSRIAHEFNGIMERS